MCDHEKLSKHRGVTISLHWQNLSCGTTNCASSNIGIYHRSTHTGRTPQKCTLLVGQPYHPSMEHKIPQTLNSLHSSMQGKFAKVSNDNQFFICQTYDPIIIEMHRKLQIHYYGTHSGCLLRLTDGHQQQSMIHLKTSNALLLPSK